MSANKNTVEKYMQAFNKLDHAAVLACLTDDVEWVLHGAFHHKGKAAFDKEIENPAFTGAPVIVVTSVAEENDVVFTEGTVVATFANGNKINLAFCDVFRMRGGLICKLTSYLAEMK